MSWQQYIDNLLATKVVAKTAIVGHDGSTWGGSPGFTVSAQEHTPIMGALKGDASATGILQSKGVLLNGVKYMFLRADPTQDAVLGRKGDAGCIAARTNKAVLYAVYEDGTQPGDFNKAVGKVQDHLKTAGY